MVHVAETLLRTLLSSLLLAAGGWLSLAPMAATLTITSETVTVSRADAANVFDLRQDAVAPIGEGDVLTTGSRGRAWIDVEGGARLLLMPESRLEIVSFQREGAIARLLVNLEGHIIASAGDAALVTIEIQTDHLRVTPTGQAAVWTNFEDGEVVTAATLTTGYEDAEGNGGTLEAGQGLYVDGETEYVTQLSQDAVFLHAAQLIGLWRGCPGIVVNTGAEFLNLRVGPGLQSSAIGYTPPGGAVEVLGISESRNWYRVQRLHGFGWVRGYYLSYGCPDDFPTFPNNRVEQNLELRDVQPDEYALLEPFYGPPDVNVWVYRSFRDSPYAEAEADPP
ncbi:MAG: SH3 domain-containing protein [Chloroflexi bacterium]|nr:SH3 domain-containing protein [Chloroflexota bacterium]